jgi:class 3 adenylate cyclase/tetratricopeptide (TPR) repeat protein
VPVSSDLLASFVPDLLARSIAHRSEPLRGSASAPCELAVLGLDISESTSISEDLVRWSPDGSESIARVLNTIFTLLADLISEHHGSVITIAGDEIVAVWPTAEMGGIASSAYWAARTATAVQDKAGLLPPVGGYPIRLRAGIGVGNAWLLDIGHDHGRRIFVPVGPAIQEMTRAQKSVGASGIGVTDNVRQLLGEQAQDHRGTGRMPIGQTTVVGPVPASSRQSSRSLASVQLASAARYIPDWVFERLRSGPEELQAELAPITAIFTSFRTGLWDEDATRTVSDAVLQALDILNSYKGTLVSACQDIDGVTLVAGFGLPPVVREREATRANLAALEISRAMEAFVEHGIGVATGHAFCGVCGSPAYRQYTMVGPVVNLAARLMQRAQNEVLCDELSQRLSRDRLRFSGRGRMNVKGFANQVQVYRPEWHESDPGLPTLRRLAESKSLTTRGRDREREQLAGRLVALSLGISTAVIVTGEPGVGKTHLAVDLLRASEGYGRITVLAGSCDDADSRPYHAWKRVFVRVLELASVRDPTVRAMRVKERLAKWPELQQWAPLLNDVLDIALDDSALRDMTGRARRENTLHTLVQLLVDAAGDAPVLIVLDDCQWMDSSSWELVRAVHRSAATVMIVLLTRPTQEHVPASSVRDTAGRRPSGLDDGGIHTGGEVKAYLRENDALSLHLQPLPPDVTEQIARDTLGVSTLQEPVRSLFRDKVGGSPLFTIELAFQLRADDVISVVGTGEAALAHLTVSAAELDRIRLPVRVEEVFRARLSALSERQRIVIRAAGVVGTCFDEERVLSAAGVLDPRSLADDLADLEAMKIVRKSPEGWQFSHALIRDAALQSLLPSELRHRHRALAEWYEANERGPETYAVLARHWAASDEPARQIEYLEAAATNALANGAEEEAASLMKTALEFESEPERGLASVSDTRKAFWHSQLGEALAGLNRLDEAVGQFRIALRLLGQRLPRSGIGWAARLVWEALKQLMHLLHVVGPNMPVRGDTGAVRQASWILSKLAESYYFKADGIPWIATNLVAINLAEKARDAGLAGRAYSGLANLVGTMRLHRLAARYFRRSRWKIVEGSSGTESRRTLEVLPDLAWQHDLTATISEAVYLRTMNRSLDVTPMMDEVIQRFRASGHNYDLEIGLAVRGSFHEARGMLRSARADFEELLTSARRRGNADHVIWGTTLLIPVLVALGQTDELINLDDEAVQLFSEDDRLSAPNFQGSHMQVLMAQGRSAEALSYAQDAPSTFGTMPVWFHFVGLTAMVRACIELLEHVRGTAAEKDVRRVSRRALRALRRYVRVFPFCRGRFDLYFGMYRAAAGKDRAARRHWARALGCAERSGLQLDGARVRLLLAGQLPEGSPARAELLRHARRTLDELGLRRLEGFEGFAGSWAGGTR